ncbi:acetyl-CoA carboxylase biotin carboxyl carrier protein subunit [bacterium]|nr:MAG: acetyl-CoA carboxylase biotin carboxyl carrier protein subunit [bacterium]
MQSENDEIDVQGEIERLVRPLLQAFDDSDLTRLSVDEEEFGLEFVRRLRPSRATEHVAAAAEQAPALAPRPVDVVAADVVGVFRVSRPQAALGQPVAAARELGYVEALGIRNPVRVGRAGTIAEVFVGDGDPVEYGQPLFGIEVDV